jgi:hypothetical protein
LPGAQLIREIWQEIGQSHRISGPGVHIEVKREDDEALRRTVIRDSVGIQTPEWASGTLKLAQFIEDKELKAPRVPVSPWESSHFCPGTLQVDQILCFGEWLVDQSKCASRITFDAKCLPNRQSRNGIPKPFSPIGNNAGFKPRAECFARPAGWLPVVGGEDLAYDSFNTFHPIGCY